MIKVIHLIPCDGVGGVETAARSMVSADFLNCDFTLLLLAGGGISKRLYRVIESPFKSANNPLAHYHAISQILKKKPDVLICSLWRSMFVGILVKVLRPRIRVVCFLHSVSSVHFADWFLNSLMMRLADAIWTDSKATLCERVGSNYKKKSLVISFVLTNSRDVSLSNVYAPRFVFWGRIKYHKGLDRALGFIKILVKKGVEPQFEIWGPDDGEKTNLLSLVHSMGLKDYIHFKGPTTFKQLGKIASQNTFYLQLSRLEGMAMSIVEAMQRGLVPIVTPVGEIANYCQPGINAVVVNDPENPVDAVKEVVSLLDDESRYRQYQEAAQECWRQARLYQDDICLESEKLAEYWK